jgi:hypothetical protein
LTSLYGVSLPYLGIARHADQQRYAAGDIFFLITADLSDAGLAVADTAARALA